VSGRNTKRTGGAEARSWRSVASGNTQLAAGAEVDPWQSVSGRITQLTAGGAPRENHLARQ
ncbi:hypothetical protein, partial [Pseudomonas aeruginosa]